MAVENENGGNSGIDTIMRTLAEKRLIEDRAPTLDGSWMQRIMEARSANGNFVYSTMTPFLADLRNDRHARQYVLRAPLRVLGLHDRNGNLESSIGKSISPFITSAKRSCRRISLRPTACSSA